ncbi:alpha/beta hydrolase-fold protein [Algoriphagus sp. SE2]|uniref:carboxylesterase family protein n=1 Tax=Algoriphagus sp. SE2 TaxID=3141536 RepID=UPI0031CD31F2
MNFLKSNYRFLALALIISFVGCDSAPTAGKQIYVSEGYSNKVVDGYWLYLPRNFDSNKKWPVILFLQGGAGVSPYPRTSKEDGPAKFALNNLSKEGKYQLVSDTFLIINPHMKVGPREKRQWYQYPNTLKSIIDEVVYKYAGDSSRIYLTGLSRGGHGSWGLAKKYPQTFAAIVPIAGQINCRSDCEKLSEIPIWIIHNSGDPTVDFEYSLNTVDYFEKSMNRIFLKINDMKLAPTQMDSSLIFSELDKDEHDAWNLAYSSNSLYEWLLTKKIQSKADKN